MGIAILGVMCIGWGDLGLSKQAIYGDILSFLSVIAVVGYLFIGQTTVKKVSHWIYSFTVFAFAGLFMGIYNVILQVPLQVIRGGIGLFFFLQLCQQCHM